MNRLHAGTAKWINNNPIIFAILIMFVSASLFVPHFFSINNFFSILQQISVQGIAAIGLTFIILSAGNDLSIGANMTLSAITGVYVLVALSENGLNIYLAIAIGLLAGIAVGGIIGMLNGFFVSKVGCNAFIFTIVMQILINGLAIFVTTASSQLAPAEFRAIASTKIFGVIPTLVIVMILFFIISQYILRRTTFGRKVYAIGANPNAAYLVGINHIKLQIILFIICGLLGGLGGMLLASRVGAATTAMGGYLFLDIMSAVIIGGTSLFGGKGDMGGTLIGTILLGIITNCFNLLGVPYNQTLIIKGAVIILAIIIEYVRTKYTKK